MFRFVLVLGLALGSLSEQLNTSEGILESLLLNGIIPDLVSSSPGASVEVNYNGFKVDFGNELTPTQVQSIPEVKYDVEPNTFYTLVNTDLDPPTREEPTLREFIHWVVANIPGSDVGRGQTIAQYLGAGPPLGTGFHRYIFLVYKQPSELIFTEPFISNTTFENRSHFISQDFASNYDLEMVAVNFFLTQYDDFVPTIHEQIGLAEFKE